MTPLGLRPSGVAAYSKKFFEAHREEITLHKAAKQAFDELGVKKIPKVKDLNEEYAELLSGKKTAYAEYRKLRDEAQELIRKTEEAVGQPVTAELYKRPKPTDNPDLERFFAWKGQIACTRSIAPGPDMFGPELKNEVADFFEKLTPLYDYFNRFKV